MKTTGKSIKHYNVDRRAMIKYIPENSKKILEVGCSNGLFCKFLVKKEREIWGIEINENAAEEAKNICNHVIIGSIDDVISKLPLKYFDCIIFNHVLEHLYEPWETLNRLKGCLNKDGVIVSEIPNFRYIGNLLTEIIIKKDFHYREEGGILDITHYRFFTSKSIQRMYNQLGFNILVHEGIKKPLTWKIKLFLFLTFGHFDDTQYSSFATVVKLIDS